MSAQALRAEGRWFRDGRGAVVLLRGLNVAGDAKVPPFRPIADAAVLDPLPALGVNVARVLFTWEAFEPERGRYDESYFAYYEGVLAALHARGAWAIVDVHQDAFSRFATGGCGDGLPQWALSPSVQPDPPDNGPDCASWGIQFILDADTHRCWDDFYADTNGVRTRYLALLDTLAARLAEHPAVIGYDLLNEPWGDELAQLGPLYEDGARTIRARDPDAVLFVSPQALTSAGQETELARPSFGNFAYAPHYYDGLVVTLHVWSGGTLEAPVEQMFQRATSWGVPLFVGEFGAPAETLDGAAYIDEFYASLDRRLASGAQWSFVAGWNEQRKDGWNDEDFSIFDAAGGLRATYRVRPFPARIPGEPESFSVSEQPSLRLELAWIHDPALGELRLFAPRERLFDGGASVDAPDDLDCGYERGGLYVRCVSALAGPKRLQLGRCLDGQRCVEEELPPEPTVPAADAGSAAVPPPGSGTRPEAVPTSGASTGAVPPRESDTGCNACPVGAPSASAAFIVAALSSLTFRRRRRR